MSFYQSNKVLKISHLPEDFTESKLINYAKQFGCTSVRVYIPRSKETLKSKGFAFISLPKEVCEPFMETLNNRFMFNKVLKCSIITNPSKGTFRKKNLKPFSGFLNEKVKQNVHLEMRKTNDNLKKASKSRKTYNFNKKLKALEGFDFKSSL